MKTIKDRQEEYKVESVNASVSEDTIIPGIMGREVNVNKSYKNMKSNGYYNEKLYIYDYFKPNISLSDNKDKYIINGNSYKRMVSLIFLITGNDDITDILKIINNYNIKVTFFVDYNWFSNNVNTSSFVYIYSILFILQLFIYSTS